MRKLFFRLHRARIERWQAGELSDKAFERAMRIWVWKLCAGLFLATYALSVLMFWLDSGRPQNWGVKELLIGFAVYASLGLVFGLRGSVNMGRAVQDLMVERYRRESEQDFERRTKCPDIVKESGIPRVYGSFRYSVRFGAMVFACALGGLTIAMVLERRFLLVLASLIGLLALYVLADRRVQLTISSTGISCRSWGTATYAYREFKAIYARRSGFMHGVVLVAREPQELRRTLSFWARRRLDSGDGLIAHRGTLTIWTSKFGLPRQDLQASLSADVDEAQRQCSKPS